jgi:predicted GNAT family N-acyltransferase
MDLSTVRHHDGHAAELAAKLLCCRVIQHGSPEYQACVALRNAVLRKPIGLLLTEEQIRSEHSDHHLACFRDGRLLACLILTPEADSKVRMRQVAVALDCQRQGVGTTLVRYSERYAAEYGYRELYAHAREAAVPFYTRLGYEVAGDAFVEVGIPHFEVRKALKAT